MYRSPRGSFGKEADAVSAVTAYAAQAAHFILPVIALIVLIRCVASMFYGRAEPETWGHLVTPDGKVYPLLHWECLIGRARSADITLPYPDVANVHAVLMRNDAGEWTVSDLSRSGGVYLNGEQITEPTQVFSGDILRCSTHMLKFADMSEERRAVQEQRRTIAGRKVSAGGTLFFLTVFQLLLALEFVSSADSAHLLGILMSFAALALTQWFCYVLMRTMDRSGFEVETIAFFLCTLGLEICATSTPDDLTKETVAACFGDTLTFDPDEWQKIVDFFTRTGRETTPNNRKQAMVPVHGHKVVNHHGTAPGAWFEQDGHCAVLMPGVPHEMKAMWEESVRPLLLARQSCALHSLTLRVLGGESNLEYRVRALLENPNPTAAIYCKTGECEIRITARAQNDAEAQTMCRAYAKKFYDLLGDAVYDEDVAGLEETVVHTLQANGLTIATAESCTGGMIAQRLTSVSGASEVFGYGFVTYWEQAKAKLVGVDPAVIAQYNVVSAPVAAQMALGAAKAAGADIAVSVTGLAGPDGGDAVRPVGTVYLGAARGDKAYVKKLFVSRPDRALIRARAAQTALEMALRLAQGKTPAGTQVLAESAQHDPAALTALDETLRAE